MKPFIGGEPNDVGMLEFYSFELCHITKNQALHSKSLSAKPSFPRAFAINAKKLYILSNVTIYLF